MEDQHTTPTFLPSVNPSLSNETYILKGETCRTVCVTGANFASMMTLVSLWNDMTNTSECNVFRVI